MVEISRIRNDNHGKLSDICVTDYINGREYQFINEYFEEKSRVLNSQSIMLMLWFNQMDLDEESVVYEDGHHMFINYSFGIPYQDEQENIIKLLEEITVALEKNERLTIRKNKVHDNINAKLDGNDLTGSLALLLLWKNQLYFDYINENEYFVLADQNLLFGIPHAVTYIAEIINTIRKLDGLEGDFVMRLVSTLNLEGYFDYIFKEVDESEEYYNDAVYSVKVR